MINLYRERQKAWQRAGLQRGFRPVQGAQGAELTCDGRTLLAFCSNDYLGLANDPRVREAAASALTHYGVGAGASALVCGYSDVQAELERELAEWLGQARSLVFSSGYLAHLGVLPVLVDQNTAVFSDALNHASLIDGIRLARPGALTVYPHADMNALEQALQQSSLRQRWIISDGVFSMDGDVAPLHDLADLAERHGAGLLIDDAHGVGVLGAQGRGSVAESGIRGEHVLTTVTFGKALGSSGAGVVGSQALVDWLAQRARTHMFSTALPPLVCAATRKAIECARAEEFRRDQLRNLGKRLQMGLREQGLPVVPSVTAIHPVMVGDNRRVMKMAEALQALGIWVAPIRPPTVPDGTARLRISLSAVHEMEQVDCLVSALSQVWRKE
ncbi:MAG: 8-amino-7-oxononanoate synthase [Betaproteobacteria bacterium]|jgi:8-amino-7-oxononanoate synthase|nr:8-amino-7-oxononanoate synthase [Betaproteobacteria bacterium]